MRTLVLALAVTAGLLGCGGDDAPPPRALAGCDRGLFVTVGCEAHALCAGGTWELRGSSWLYFNDVFEVCTPDGRPVCSTSDSCVGAPCPTEPPLADREIVCSAPPVVDGGV